MATRFEESNRLIPRTLRENSLENMNRFLSASLRLHDYISANHWNGKGIFGPDYGVRFNYRIGRFIKGYLNFVHWNDSYYYLQAQGYWIMSNWILFDILRENKYANIAIDCSSYVLETQQPQGYWEYPNPEWKGRIATVEGTFAALGLLETHNITNEKRLLAGALKWYEFTNKEIGYEQYKDSMAINYFAKRKTGLVPNNSTLQLMFVARLYESTKQDQYLALVDPLIKFIQYAQRESGELPYSLNPSFLNKSTREHFLCYQYNAFEFLDLLRCFEVTKNSLILNILKKLCSFLSHGLKDNGCAKYDCFSDFPEVTYHTGALAAAFLRADRISPDNFKNLSDIAYSFILSQQNANGRFDYSRKDYRFLSDKRSYPRSLTMMLYHLLLRAKEDEKITRFQFI